MDHPLRLYSYWRSSCSFRVRLALHYKAIPFEVRPIHLVKNGGEQYTEDFKRLNPRCEVPVLQYGPWSLTQSMAILMYLEEVFAQKPLLAAEGPLRYQTLEIVEMINTGIQPLQNLKILNKVKGLAGSADSEASLKWGRDVITEGLMAVEEKLQCNKTCLGLDSITLADCFLLPQVYNARRFNCDESLFPKASAIYDHLNEWDLLKPAFPEEQEDAPKT